MTDDNLRDDAERPAGVDADEPLVPLAQGPEADEPSAEGAGAPDDEAGEEATDELATHVAEEIRELADQRDQYKDIAQRLQADFENYRKRVSGQLRDEAERAAARMAEALL